MTMELPTFLDTIARRLEGDEDAIVVTNELCTRLNEFRRATTIDEWETSVRKSCLSHPLRAIVHQDPYTRRAFDKPRGYAGDGVMLDYVYDGMAPEDTTTVGKRVFQGTTRLPSGLSVIERRDYLASVIDQTARDFDRARVLAVACGHLREAQRSEALRAGAIDTLYALDQDPANLAVVDVDKPPKANIVTVKSTVGPLLRGNLEYDDLHLIYVFGLYDYLNDAQAARLTANLFGMLATGGKLVLANYAPDSHGRAYMEAFMDWSLVYRDEADMAGCTHGVPDAEIGARRTFRERHGNIVFTELVRA